MSAVVPTHVTKTGRACRLVRTDGPASVVEFVDLPGHLRSYPTAALRELVTR